MSTYNLKAKNRETREIINCAAIDNGDSYSYIPNDDIWKTLTQDEFNTLYEVIDDKPVIKENLKTDWRESLQVEVMEDYITTASNKYLYDLDTGKFEKDMRQHFIKLQDFISQVETQAYKQGQADAYRESLKCIQETTDYDHEKCPLPQSCIGYMNATEDIYKAIEQLSSNQ